MTRVRVMAGVAACAALSIATQAGAEILEWRFAITPEQVKNADTSASDGSGQGHVVVDTDAETITVEISWSNLLGSLTKLHIHGPATEDESNGQHLVEYFNSAQEVADAGLDGHNDTLMDSNRVLVKILDHDFPGVAPSFKPKHIIAIMEAGFAYVNVHTTQFPMGEIRGNLGLPIPEPTSLAWIGLGVSAIFSRAAGRRQQRRG